MRTIVNKQELGEAICLLDEGYKHFEDLIYALASRTDETGVKVALVNLKRLADAAYYELSGEKAADEWLEGVEYDDFVASVLHAAAA